MHLIASFGWTWEYIDDHMTIPRMTAINAVHKLRPPVYIVQDDLRRMIAGYLGVELDAKEAAAQDPNSSGRAADGSTLFDLFTS